MATPERRSFFRVNSEIALSFHSVDTNSVNQGRPDEQFPAQKQSLDLLQELRRLEREAAPLLASVGEQNRALADYLSLLNRRIDLLTQASVASDYLTREVRPSHVNLSEGGIAFNSSKAVYKDSYLALRMLFLADFSQLACFAQVIRCEANQDRDGYKIACRFIGLNDAKQETLGRHIMQAQLSARRKGLQAGA